MRGGGVTDRSDGMCDGGPAMQLAWISAAAGFSTLEETERHGASVGGNGWSIARALAAITDRKNRRCQFKMLLRSESPFDAVDPSRLALHCCLPAIIEGSSDDVLRRARRDTQTWYRSFLASSKLFASSFVQEDRLGYIHTLVRKS